MEELDLDKLPRRMPYTVPEGTFDAIEHSVLAAIAREQQADQVAPIPPLVPTDVSPAAPPTVPTGRPQPARVRRLLPWLGSAVVVAAVTIWAILTLAPHRQVPQPEVAPTLESVALAFEKLSPADQEFILSTYQDDMYVNF
jgi:hypothetical protein